MAVRVSSNTVPQKSLDILIERFLASLRFEQRRKLDQLGIEFGSFVTEGGDLILNLREGAVNMVFIQKWRVL